MELLKLNKKYGVGIGRFIYISLLMVFSTSITYFLAISYKSILDNFGQTKLLNPRIIFYVAATIIYGISFYLVGIAKVKVVEKRRNYLQEKLLGKLIDTKLNRVENLGKGSFQTAMEEDIETLAGFNNGVIFPAVGGLTQFGLGIFYGFNNSVLLTVLILVLTVLAMILPEKLAILVGKTQGEKMKDMDSLNNKISDFISNSILFKTFKAEKYVYQSFNKEFDSFAKSSVEVVDAESLVLTISYAGGFLIGKVWMFVGIYLISINKLTFGEYVGFLTLSTSLSVPFDTLPAVFSEYNKIKASDKRFEELLAYEEELGGIENCNINSPIYKEEDIEFTYVNEEEANNRAFVFKEFTLNKGDKVELAGPSGCGKSTLMKVLLGFYNAKENVSVNIKGKKYTGKDIYKVVTYVPQVPLVFNASVLNNVMYGSVGRNVSKEEVVEACKEVNLHKFILGLENGYESVIEEKTLSTGQKQRLSIARALISKKEVIFLDEITSALDSENEKLVLEVVKDKFETVVLISHKEEGKMLCNRRYEVWKYNSNYLVVLRCFLVTLNTFFLLPTV